MSEWTLAERREAYVKIEELVHVELAVLVMDSQNALEFLTRALTLCSIALADAAALHQQETVKLVRTRVLTRGKERSFRAILDPTQSDTHGDPQTTEVVRKQFLYAIFPSVKDMPLPRWFSP